MRIRITQEVPGGTGPLGHGIRLSLRRASAAGAGGLHPVSHSGKRGFTIVGGHVAFHIGKLQRKLIFRNRHIAALRAVHDRNRLAPVTLSGKYPVSELIIRLGRSKTVLLQIFRDGLLCLSHLHPVQETGIYQLSGSDIREGRFVHIHRPRAALHHLDDGHVELLRELPVSFIMAGNRHDGARSVAHQHVIGNPDGNLLVIHRIDGGESLDHHARLVLGKLGTLEIGLS